MLVLSEVFRAWLPARVKYFHDVYGVTDTKHRVTVNLIHTFGQDETLPCKSARALFKNLPIRKDSKGNAVYPLLYPTHHPAYMDTSVNLDQDQDAFKRDLVPKPGTRVFAPWPEDGRYHIAAIADDAAVPGNGAGVPVIFFQDPQRKDIADHLVVRVDKASLILLPKLPVMPAYKGRVQNRYAKETWEKKLLADDADISVGQWVSGNWKKWTDSNEKENLLLGKVSKVSGQGYSMKPEARDTKSRAVLLQRAELKPLLFGLPTVYKRTGTPVWPKSAQAPQKTGKPMPPMATPRKIRAFGRRQNGVVEGTTSTVKNNRGEFRVESGWNSIRELPMFDTASPDNPTVTARLTTNDVPGTLDASAPNCLFVWRTNDKFVSHVKVLISPYFDVMWHKAKAKGIDGIQVKVTHDGNVTFSIRLQDEKAAKRCMRSLKKKWSMRERTRGCTGTMRRRLKSRHWVGRLWFWMIERREALSGKDKGAMHIHGTIGGYKAIGVLLRSAIWCDQGLARI